MLTLTRMAPLVSRFLAEYPRVQVQYEVTNRRVDVIEEGFDVALRVRMPPLESSDLVMKVLGESTLLLVGSPALIEWFGRPHSPIVAADIASGKLEVLLPGWPSPGAIIHAVFPSRRGLVPAVRRFIDFLAVEMSEA